MNLFFDLIFIITVAALIVVNVKTMLLPNAIIFPGFIIAFLVRLFLVIAGTNNVEAKPFLLFSSPVAATIFDSLAGALIGLGTLWIFNKIWYQMRGFEVVGYGDIKMLAMIGAYLGILNVIGVLCLGAILFTVFIFLLKAITKGKLTVLPSGFIWGLPAILFTLISINQIIARLSR